MLLPKKEMYDFYHQKSASCGQMLLILWVMRLVGMILMLRFLFFTSEGHKILPTVVFRKTPFEEGMIL